MKQINSNKVKKKLNKTRRKYKYINEKEKLSILNACQCIFKMQNLS